MSDSEIPATNDILDLRLLPSWLKEESSPAQSYANFDGEDRSDRRGGRDDRRGPRPPQNRDQRDSRGSGRQGAPGGSRPPSGPRPPQREGRPPESRGPQRNDSQNRRQGPPDRRQEDRPHRPEERPAPVEIWFLPEAIALEKVTEQLKSAPIAYPLFGVAKMFLQRPERHQIQIKALPEAKLYKLQGTAHLSTDRTRLEAIAFKELGEKYFKVEITEAPEIKGNFTAVARSGLTGKVFGPTNHHTFQTGMHKEYEERFSRRMSFADYQRNIETTKDPAAVELWKAESRRIESYRLLSADEMAAAEAPQESPLPANEPVNEPELPVSEVSETPPEPAVLEVPEESIEPTAESPSEEAAPEVQEEPVVEAAVEPASEVPAGKTFATPQEAEAYFRSEILPGLIVETESETLTGQQARQLSDRRLAGTVRSAWDAEAKYPLGLVNAIRVKFNQQNLHIFKFKKRVLLISSLKPAYLDDKSESLSPSIREVLQVIQGQPGIDRKGLAEKIVNADASASDESKLARKQSLISDLHWLVRQGNVIEFSDGTFDLPLGPKAVLAEAAAEPVEKVAVVPVAVEESSVVPQEQ